MKLFGGAVWAAALAFGQVNTEAVTLLIDDSHTLNEILKGIHIKLDETKVAADNVDVNVKDLECHGFSVESFNLSVRDGSSAQRQEMDLSMRGFTTECSAIVDGNYKFEGLPFGAKIKPSSLTVEMEVTELDLILALENPGFDSKASIVNCGAQVEFNNFHTSLLSDYKSIKDSTWLKVLNQLSGALTGAVCSALKDPVTALQLNMNLNELDTLLDEFRALTPEMVDPLSAEVVSGHREDWVDFVMSDIFSMAFSAFNAGYSTTKEENAMFGPLNETIWGPTNASASDLFRSLTNHTGTYVVDTSGVVLFSTSTQGNGMSAGIHLSMDTLEIHGLDSVIAFDPIKVFGPHTFGTNISFGRVNLVADLVVDFWVRVPDLNLDVKVEQEKLRAALTMINTDISLVLNAGIDTKTGWDIPFGSALHNPLECFLSTVKHVNFTRVWGDIGELEDGIKVTSFLGDEVNGLLQSLLDSVVSLYEDAFLSALPGILLEEGPALVTDGVKTFVENNKVCPEPIRYPDEPYFDFSGDSYFQDLVQLIRRDIVPNFNVEYVREFTHANSGEEGVFILQEEKDMEDLNIGPIGRFHFSASKVQMKGLDSFYDVNFMDTPSPFVLRNEFKLGGDINYENGRRILSHHNTSESLLGSNGTSSDEGKSGSEETHVLPPFTLSFILEIDFDGHEVDFDNMFEFSIEFQGLSVGLDFLAMVDRYRFDLLTIEQLFSFDCLLSRLEKAEILELSFVIDAVRVGIECISCSSPGMLEMEEKVRAKENQEQFTQVLNQWVTDIRKRFEAKMTPEVLEDTIRDANAKCIGTYQEPVYAKYKGSHESSVNLFAIIGGMALTMFLGVIISLCLKARAPSLFRRKSKSKKGRADSETSEGSVSVASWGHRFYRFNSTSSDGADIVIRTDSVTSDSAGNGVENEEELDTDDELLEAFERSPLVSHPITPVPIRICVTVTLLTNIFLFVVGHLIICANVNITFMVLGEEIPMHGFAGFSIGKSIKDMWNAGVYPLAILIASLSGAWPYIKVLTMLVCWITPPRFLGPKRRGSILMVYDKLGKWSMIDVYVLLLIMVAFGVKIENPRLNILPEGFYGVYVVVDPDIGLISFTLAAMLSLLVNNICLNYHRNAETARDQLLLAMEQEKMTSRVVFGTKKDRHETSDEVPHGRRRRFSTWLDAGTTDVASSSRELAEKKEALKDHVFQLYNGDKVRFTRIGVISIVSLLVITLLLIIVGASVFAFGFKIYGLVGMFMDVDEVKSWMPYSVFDLFTFAVDQALESKIGGVGYVTGVIYLAIAYLLTAFIMPVIEIIGLLVFFLRPFSLQRQKWAFFLAEVFGAWAAIDVFIVALIIAVLEMGQLSGFLLGGVCKHILPKINGVLVPSGFVEEDDATCLFLGSSLEAGTAILLTAAFFANFLGQIVLRAGHKALHEREWSIKHLVKGETVDHKQEHKPPGCFSKLVVSLGMKLRWIEPASAAEDLDPIPGNDQLAVTFAMDRI